MKESGFAEQKLKKIGSKDNWRKKMVREKGALPQNERKRISGKSEPFCICE